MDRCGGPSVGMRAKERAQETEEDGRGGSGERSADGSLEEAGYLRESDGLPRAAA